MPRTFYYTKPHRDAAERLLDFLCRRFTYLSRDEWAAQIAEGHLTVDGRVTCCEDEAVLQQGQRVTFAPPRALEPSVDESHIEVVYEDEWCVVCAKNGNLPVSEGGRYCDNTLVALLTRRGTACFRASATHNCNESSSRSTFYTVHRLDKETSGLVILAKSAAVACQLSQLFTQAACEVTTSTLPRNVWLPPEASPALDTIFRDRQQLVRKRYIAVLVGCCPHVGQDILITTPIGPLASHPTLKDRPEHRQLSKLKMLCYGAHSAELAMPQAKSACTRIHVLATSAKLNVSLVGVDLMTGRTHQIRVHCAHLGHPILGDKLYTSSQPGVMGHSEVVSDEAYLAAVRADGEAAYVSHPLVPQLRCRRHLLHAVTLDFIHPLTKECLHLYSAPLSYFALDVRCASESANTDLHHLLQYGRVLDCSSQ